eukprot:2625630-Pleurochrysis_carterae.AAC.1
MLYRKPETVVDIRDIIKEDRRRRRESTFASQSAPATAPNPTLTPPTSPPGMDSTDYETAWERLHPPAMTVREYPSPGDREWSRRIWFDPRSSTGNHT